MNQHIKPGKIHLYYAEKLNNIWGREDFCMETVILILSAGGNVDISDVPFILFMWSIYVDLH